MPIAPRSFLAFALIATAAVAQDAAKADEVSKLEKVDPFTGGDPVRMQALGIERYGPFPWADGFTTADIDKVLGEGRILWMETRHFRIGLNLATARLPNDPAMRKLLRDECEALHDKLAAIPERPKKVGPWLRLHLYAQRCEQAYAEFQKLMGETDDDHAAGGRFLGMKDKLLLLLFQKKSDMARYMDRFCNTQADDSMRFYHDRSEQMLLCVSAEGMDGFDAGGLHGHVVYGLWQNMINGYRGNYFATPLWLSVGVAHYYSRRIPTEFVNARVRDDESVAREGQNKWAEKVLRRARHEGALLPFEELAAIGEWQRFGFHAHSQAWSRIDFLMERDSSKVGQLIRQVKAAPAGGDYDAQSKVVRDKAPRVVSELFTLEPAAFDAEWREWVLKTYPKRKQ